MKNSGYPGNKMKYIYFHFYWIWKYSWMTISYLAFLFLFHYIYVINIHLHLLLTSYFLLLADCSPGLTSIFFVPPNTFFLLHFFFSFLLLFFFSFFKLYQGGHFYHVQVWRKVLSHYSPWKISTWVRLLNCFAMNLQYTMRISSL